MKKRIAILYIITIILVSCSSSTNIKNLQKVHKGMQYKDVYSIMGPPDTIMQSDLDAGSMYRLIYEPPFGYSDNINIHFSIIDSTVKVISDGSQ